MSAADTAALTQRIARCLDGHYDEGLQGYVNARAGSEHVAVVLRSNHGAVEKFMVRVVAMGSVDAEAGRVPEIVPCTGG